jgi:DNA-binding transcriptional LysR family regulator
LGNLYYQRCREVVEELDDIELAVTEFQQKPTGQLKVSTPNLLGEMHIVPAVAEFLATYPALEVELNFYSRRVDLVEDGSDVAIQVGRREDQNVVNRELARTRFQLVASPRFLNRNGSPGKPEDLKSLRCLFFTEHGSSKPWRLRKGELEVTIRGRCYWQSNSGHCLLAAARAGLGVAYLPDYYLANDIRDGTLVPVLDEWCGVDRDIVAIYQHRRLMTTKLRLFVDFLARRFKENRPW